MAHPYIPNSVPEVRARMLAAVGAASVEEFYADIPASIRLDRPLDLPAPLASEAELVRHMDGLLARNSPGALSFLGAGCYQHHVPAVVDEVGNRSEFLTAYAGEPYEDHGRFQALWEYQALMGELLELDVVNVPTYDGYQASGTALRMAGRVTGRRTLLVAGPVNPDKLSKIADYVRPDHDLVFVTVEEVADPGFTVGPDVAAVYAEAPDYHGVLAAGLPALAHRAHEAGALFVVGCNPISLGVVAPPATYGADIVCGDIQPLGIHMSYGGGNAGFIATRDEERLVQEFPSRLFGVIPTVVEGEYGFGDVYYDRTSFALREEGKEWVGTAAALHGIMAGVYLALMGPQGMREVGETILANTAYAQERLAAVPGVSTPSAAAGRVSFADFLVRYTGSRTAAEVNAALLERGVHGGKVLSDTDALFCVTEIHSRADIDRLAQLLQEVAA